MKTTMIRVMLLLLTVLLLPACSINKAFVKGVDSGTSVILPRYEEYVTKDATLDEDSKKERIRTSTELKKLIEDAKKE